MATTLGDVITRVRFQLRSFTGSHEQTTYLTGSALSTDLTLSLANGNNVDVGLIEVDDELIWVEQSDNGVATIPPFGRGYNGTTAASHAVNAQVISDPMFPRKAVTDAINDTARAVYPDLFAVKSAEFAAGGTTSTYGLPADCDRILAVSQDTSGSSGEWRKVKRYRLVGDANTTEYPNGKAITIGELLEPGRSVRVVYAAPFTDFALSTDTLVSAGFKESMTDVLAFGAAWRLVQFMESSRLQLDDVSNQERAKYSQQGAASALARQLLAVFSQRVEQERIKLLQLHKPTSHFDR